MKELLIIISVASTLLSIIALIFFIRGVVILISGKCRLRANPLTGKSARGVGLAFIVVPVIAFALWAMMYEGLDWGSYGSSVQKNAMKSIASSSVQSILFIAAVLGSYFWALSKARALRREKFQQPTQKPAKEEETHVAN